MVIIISPRIAGSAVSNSSTSTSSSFGTSLTKRIELLTSDPDEARRAIESAGRRAPVGEARFLRPPRVVEERELHGGTWLVRGRADVAPTMEWLAEGLLVGALKAQLRSDALLADPIVSTLDEGTLSRYERRVLVS